MPKYEVIVGNVGKVTDTENEIHAQNQFNAWKYLSQCPHGRAAGEPVTLMKDGEIVREYSGTNREEGE